MDRLIYKLKKSYIAPFWIMFAISIIVTIEAIGLSILQNIRDGTSSSVKSNFGTWFVSFAILLWSEAVMYWIIRKKIKSKPYVWLHVCSIALAFIIIPIILVVVLGVAARSQISAIEYKKMSGVAGQIQGILFIVLFFAGHAFFITTLVKSFKKKTIIAEDEVTPGILDGLIDEE